MHVGLVEINKAASNLGIPNSIMHKPSTMCEDTNLTKVVKDHNFTFFSMHSYSV